MNEIIRIKLFRGHIAVVHTDDTISRHYVSCEYPENTCKKDIDYFLFNLFRCKREFDSKDVHKVKFSRLNYF